MSFFIYNKNTGFYFFDEENFLSFLNSSKVNINLLGQTTLNHKNISFSTEYINKVALRNIEPYTNNSLKTAQNIENKLKEISSEIKKEVSQRNLLTRILFYISNFFKRYTHIFNTKGISSAHYFTKKTFKDIFPWAKLPEISFYNKNFVLNFVPYYKEPDKKIFAFTHKFSKIIGTLGYPNRFLSGAFFGAATASIITYKYSNYASNANSTSNFNSVFNNLRKFSFLK